MAFVVELHSGPLSFAAKNYVSMTRYILGIEMTFTQALTHGAVGLMPVL